MRLLLIALCCALVGETIHADDTVGTELKTHVLARLSDAAQPDGARRLYIFSEKPLISVRYENDGKWNWMEESPKQDKYYVYKTQPHQIAEGQTFQFAGVDHDYVEVSDKLTVEEIPNVKAEAVSEGKLKTFPVLTRDVIYNGSNSIHPHQLAQARANEMARRRSMTHWGNAGSLRTCVGRLCEGIGMGGRNCGTCTATNGTAAVGDGQCQLRGGANYRCRLYDSPGTSSGGGSYGRRRR